MTEGQRESNIRQNLQQAKVKAFSHMHMALMHFQTKISIN